MRSDRALELLERRNPIDVGDLPEADAPKARLLRDRILLEEVPAARPRRTMRRGLVGASAVGAPLAVAAIALLAVGLPAVGPGSTVEDAAAAVERAATATVASAQQSGTVVVRITHGRELWASTTIRWHGRDLALSRDAGRPPRRAGSELLVVDGVVYGIDPTDGRWVEQGSPANIDPDSGTTPDEYLAAVREDVAGPTLRRITGGMTGLTADERDGGSRVYRGSVAAGLVARESGFKGGRPIRVLPFGHVAHGEAADPTAAVDAAVTVGADGVVRELTVTWGAGPSAWTYDVVYSALGETPKPVAPANARSLLRERLRAGA